jgi:phage portal protein BeeE
LLRSDLPTRYAAYSTGIGAGFLLPDEARALEDMPPLPDDDADNLDDVDDMDDDDIVPTSTPEVPA